MKTFSKFAAATLVAGCLIAPAAQAQDDERVDRMSNNRMAQWDTDGSGTVSLEEFRVFRVRWVEENNKNPNWAEMPAIRRTFSQFDANGDGEIDMDEMRAHTARQLANG